MSAPYNIRFDQLVEIKRALAKDLYHHTDLMLLVHVQWWRLAVLEKKLKLAELEHKIIRTILDRRYQRTHYIPAGNRVYWFGTNVPMSIAGMAIARRLHVRKNPKDFA
ncbi:MAG TPA: hypothetical protein VHW72_18370 [Candidatus Angelobacter sp.]|jgi:hypothetical protein|nr:hypothetical protein [Candidatus Angelobacter sp.]